ncbi:Molybdopterin-guanine dinucleotide biosynthesis adapter protein [compost metagenome]
MTETPEQLPLDLHYLASRFDSDKVDVILVEGFKHEPVSKIILYRENIGRPLEDMLDKFVIAVASDRPVAGITSLDLNQPETIAAFIVEWLKGAA